MFFLRDQDDATYVAHACLEGKFTLNTGAIGTYVPLVMTAAGHAILAHLDAAALAEVVPELKRNLVLTRTRCLAFNASGFVHGVDSMAVPVFGPAQRIEGAVSMIFPAGSYDPDRLPTRLLSMMRQCAVNVGATL